MYFRVILLLEQFIKEITIGTLWKDRVDVNIDYLLAFLVLKYHMDISGFACNHYNFVVESFY